MGTVEDLTKRIKELTTMIDSLENLSPTDRFVLISNWNQERVSSGQKPIDLFEHIDTLKRSRRDLEQRLSKS